MTDENGETEETTEYVPFGGVREHTGTEVSNYQYTDQELDPESGLYNYNARLYDPVIGRFISADPIVPYPFDPQSLNRYSYVRNNQMIYVDPSGYHLGGYNGPTGDYDFVDNPGYDGAGPEEGSWGSDYDDPYNASNDYNIAYNGALPSTPTNYSEDYHQPASMEFSIYAKLEVVKGQATYRVIFDWLWKHTVPRREPGYKPPPYRTDKVNPFPEGWWKDNAFTQLYNDLRKPGTVREFSPQEKAIMALIADQLAQVAAQSLAYSCIHPGVGIGLTVVNLTMTISGIEFNPPPAE